MSMYAFDTETERNERSYYTRVWHWMGVSVDGNIAKVKEQAGLSSKSMIAAFKKISFLDKSPKIYFHNLKFDGSYILNELNKQGFVWVDAKPKDLGPGQYTTLISSGRWFNISLRFNNSTIVKIFDSLKLLPMSIAGIAKSLGLSISKGEIDYNKKRRKGFRPDKNEWSYLRRDVLILKAGLLFTKEAGFKKMTIASSVLNIIKKKYLPDFTDTFPQLSAYENELAYAAYRGGFSYVNPLHQLEEVHDIHVYDLNSGYPWAMRNMLLPYGSPVTIEGDYDYNRDKEVAIKTVRIDAVLKQGVNYVPTVQIKDVKGINPREYQRVLVNQELVLTDVDIDLIYANYDVLKLTVHETMLFKARVGTLGEFIEDYMAMKIKATEEGNKGKRTEAKLSMNSSYGKFGSKEEQISDIPVFKNGILTFEHTTEYTAPVYVPYAAFVTAYVRQRTITAAMQAGAQYVYSDTDSVHTIGTLPPDTIPEHPTKLGFWKDETDTGHGKIVRGRYIRSKLYYLEYEFDDKKKTGGAGITPYQWSQIDFDNFKSGLELTGKLVPKQWPGGLVLQPTTFTIK